MSKKILVVEDNVDLANLYKSRLETEGYEVRVEGESEKALPVAIEFVPDLILLDVMMPKVDGFDVLHVLRDTKKTEKVKVVLLTALSQASDKKQAAELLADDYLVKSEVGLDEVVGCIRKNIG